jgi:hypothetical protein
LDSEEWSILLTVRIQHHLTSFFGAMKEASAAQYSDASDTIDDLFMGVEIFLGELSADF